ncbi:ATP-binding cassette domain-containing protein [Shewanella sp. 202IG2-18]|uniref:oligopeptide/dipeptide ABC transporter ATP-binding protein n=1 Tax=Parashewanella hymeniacidonis TaxID=2807618 RepID=UPI00195FC5BD|nr:oligopeptide/dipeptide ABC transporter ATP-binding protein [Parashewanella hymeniacidonis]MBM7073776.1 ATP-binding cassette domain-containing protein [Parashewanella hymeniacidonis]
MPLLDIRNLTIELNTPHGKVKALERISLTLNVGEIQGLVGESGSGRSLLAKAIIGLSEPNWTVNADRLMFDGKNLMTMSNRERRALMGKHIAMVFQDPTGSFDPANDVGSQLLEVMPVPKGTPFWRRHSERKKQAEKWLHKVGIKNTKEVMDSYAWELSDGECQKAMIAMAIANKPQLLIADEPTTNMEASTRAQIFRLLNQLNQLQNVSILLISHELENLTKWCNTLTVIYCGQIAESGPTSKIMEKPFHPYTRTLLAHLPNAEQQVAHKSMMQTMPGSIPALQHLPIGCRLGPRCPKAERKCVNQPLIAKDKDRNFACHFPFNRETDNDANSRS